MTSYLRLPVRRCALFAAVCTVVLSGPLHAQRGAPPTGLQFAFQPAFTFGTFTGGEPEVESYGRRRGTSLMIRASHFLWGATSGYVELGTAGRGSTISRSDLSFDVRTTWWDLGVGANVALRCVGPVCPSVDVGGVFSRVREAVLRDDASGRPVGTLPIADYEQSLSVGLRLALPRYRGVALVLRHQEGLSNLSRDDVAFRSRAQLLQISLPLTRN